MTIAKRADDLIERLREGISHEPDDVPRAEKLMDEAADALAQCRAEVERLQAFLLSSTHGQEYERLRTEVERLHHDFTMADAAVVNQRQTVQRWQAENVALRARVAELEGALGKYRACQHGGINCPCTDVARAALKRDTEE